MTVFSEPIYDLDELFRYNFHIHTRLSRCAKQEMTVDTIVRTAANAGLKAIALTDHIHPGETWKLPRNQTLIENALAQTDAPLTVYPGAELSAYGIDRRTACFDDSKVAYRLYAHNHYHMYGWEHPEDVTPDGYRSHMLRVIANTVLSGRADCLAHPFTDYYIVREVGEKYGWHLDEITSRLTDNDLGDVMLLCREYRTGLELNTSVLFRYPDFAKRLYHLGKETGVTFYPGTDAHTPGDIDPAPLLPALKTLLY